MRKIKIFLKCTILVCAVTLCGCSGEQLDKWNEVTQIPAETADGTPDIEEHYVEVCREKAKALAKKEITFQDAGEQVRYFKIQKLGDGIAVFLNSVESEDSTSDDCVVLRTQDGGNTWQMNPELLSLSHGGGELRLVENHVLIVEYNDQLESTECFVSHDYGRSFTSYSAGEVAFQSKIYPHGTFRGEIVEIDEAAKLITIAWNTESPYPSKEKRAI